MAATQSARRFNLEFCAAEAPASPYLQLGALVRAGLDEIRRGLAPPHLTTGDPGDLTPDERQARGIGVLPSSLGEALDALEADLVALDWLGPTLAKAYIMHKRGEIGTAEGQDLDGLCALNAMAD